jgi:hypothetical protein
MLIDKPIPVAVMQRPLSATPLFQVSDKIRCRLQIRRGGVGDRNPRRRENIIRIG